MVDFPADLIIDILSRLPVTSLLRFGSISKSCQSLIDSHYFQTLHLNKFRKSKSNLILEDYSKLYAVDFPTLSTAVNFNQPLNSKWSNTILGSCNGLLCIKNANGDVAIWTPSLRKHWILPPATLSYINYGFGFGFDPLTGDYKLVTISCPYSTRVGSAYESRLNLFSCRTNAWKTLLIIPFALRGFQIGVFVDHTLHWVVVNVNHKLPGPNLIVAFDLRFEVFNEVPLPELGEGFEIDVSHLGKCLSIVVNHQNPNTEIDIWVMKQYGCKDSWFKLFTVVKPFEFKFVKPLGYYSEDDDGMKVLLKEKGYSNKLCWYNLKSKQVSLVTIPGIYKFSDPIIWVESIVQPPFPSEATKAAAGVGKAKAKAAAAGIGMHI